MGEKEAREIYRRYHEEIAPLIAAAAPDEQAQEYLRAYENLRQRLLEIADSADNDSARVGALREFRNTLADEIKLRQHVGLMPKQLADADVARTTNCVLNGWRKYCPGMACRRSCARNSWPSSMTRASSSLALRQDDLDFSRKLPAASEAANANADEAAAAASDRSWSGHAASRSRRRGRSTSTCSPSSASSTRMASSIPRST